MEWDAQMKPLISEKQKLFIFRVGAGQEFASAARRANHFKKKRRKWQQHSAFLSNPHAVALTDSHVSCRHSGARSCASFDVQLHIKARAG
jgi:hypothetical protein